MKKTTIFVIAITTIIIAIVAFIMYKATYQPVQKNDSSVIFEIKEPINYQITTNEMVDTFLIACSMYLDFNSHVIMPNTESHALYTKAKAHFSPYTDHPFIKEFDKYTFGMDMNTDAIGVLISYSSTPELTKLYDVDASFRKYTFKYDQAIDDFINGLRDFYQDTQAHDFFQDNMELTMTMKNYVINRMGDTRYADLIQAMEAYVDTKDKYYGDKPIQYKTLLSLYRPAMASFYKLETDEAHIITTFQSPNDFNKDPYIFDAEYMVETVIHEYIHLYINRPIEKLTNKICRNISKYHTQITDNPMYKNMALYRQVDEYLVRAIEGRIYRSIMDEQVALNRILKKEIQQGFPKLMEPYQLLEEYENGRDVYTDIDSFLPILIEKLTRR